MSSRIGIVNPNIRTEYTTYLTAQVTSATPVSNVPVENTDKFETNDLVIVRMEGSETSEVAKITNSATPTAFALDELELTHEKGEEIRRVPYDVVEVYRSDTSGGTYAEISGSPHSIDYNKLTTYIDDSSGSPTSWYKVRFSNSVSLAVSDYSEAFQADSDNYYCTIDDVLEEAGVEYNENIDTGLVFRYREYAEGEIKGSISSVYVLPLSETPAVVRSITKLLASGRLLWKLFGEDGAGTSRDGIAKIKEARTMLKAIRETTIRLLDSNDQELGKVESPLGQAKGWPDDTTAEATDDDNGGAQLFKITDKF